MGSKSNFELSADEMRVHINNLEVRIAELEMMNEALTLARDKSELKYRDLLENMEEGFSLHEIITDENGRAVDFRFLETNDAYEHHTGLHKWEVIGRTMLEILPQTDSRQIETYGKVALTGEPMQVEYYSKTFMRHLRVRAFCPRQGQFAAIFEDITDRKGIEAKFQESEAKYRLLFENCEEAIMLNCPDGSIYSVNPAACRMFGRSEEELFKIGSVGIVDLQDPRLSIAIVEMEKTGKYIGELDYIRKDGTIFQCEVSSSLFIDVDGNKRISTIIRDISERKRAEAALRESEDKFRTMVRLSPEATGLFDAAGNVLMMNLVAAEILGYNTPDELIGKNVLEFFLPEEKESVLEMIKKTFINGIVRNIEYTLVRKNGTSFRAEYSCSALYNAGGKPRGLLVVTRDITERDKAQEKMKILQRAVEQAPVSIVLTNIYGDMEYVNPKFCDVTGYSREEVLGTNSRILKSNNTAYEVYEELWSCILSGKDWTGEFQNKKKNGDFYWVLVNISPIFNSIGKITHFLAVKEDITERRQQEEALRQSNQKLEAIILASPDGIGLGNMEHQITFVSNRLLEMYGYSLEERNEVIGKSAMDFIDPSSLKLLAENIAKRFAGESNEKDYTRYLAIKKDKSRFYIEVNAVLMHHPDGKPMGILNIERDVTERVKLEEELVRSNSELKKANSEKDKFFSIIAHDLRSPFTGLLGLTELMTAKDKMLSIEECVQISKLLRESVVNAYKLLENLLEWAMIQKGSFDFLPAELSLSNLFIRNIEPLNERARQKGITIFREITGIDKITADEKLISTVLRNLLANALKFTDRGGEVSIGAKETEDGMIEISVTDTGIGIPKDVIDKLFILGEKVGTTGTDDEPSTGLGLILCKEFVEKHSGKIWVESQENVGSTFYFTIPKKYNG